MRILISKEGEPSQVARFDGKTEIKIGRVAGNDLVLAERGVSSHHARLQLDAGQLILTDLGSTNGTFVNGQRIHGAHPISGLDEVFVCHIKLEIELPEREPSLPAAIEPPVFEGPPVLDRPPVLDDPPVFDAPPVLEGPPVLDGPPLLLEAPTDGTQRGSPSFDGPPVLDEPLRFEGPPSIEIDAEPALELSRVLTKPSARALPIDPASTCSAEWTARGTVFRALLVELGVRVEHPPESGEKQRKAARVGAKRRFAVIQREDPSLKFDELGREADALVRELFELGPLTAALADPSVRELVVRGPHRILVDRGQGRVPVDAGFSSVESLRLALHRWVGAPLDWGPSCPWLEHRMPDGTRLRGADISVAPGGPVLVITRGPEATSVELDQVEGLPKPIAEYLAAVIRARGSVLVCFEPGCEGDAFASACAHELSTIDPNRLGIVRTSARLTPPSSGLVLDAEPGLTARAIQLAIDAGSTSLLLHHAGGAGLAHAWVGLERGVNQVVVGVAAEGPELAVEACVEGLRRGGYGLVCTDLRARVAASIDVVVALARGSNGAEVPVWLGELDERGQLQPSLTRSSSERPWQHHKSPAFLPELARRGVRFDPHQLASLAHPSMDDPRA